MKIWTFLRFLQQSLVGPFLWALFCVLFSFSPFHFLSDYHQAFPVVLIILFYFSILAPKKLNVFLVFFLGLIADCLSTSVFGMYCFIFSFFFLLSTLIRNYVKLFNFLHLWLVFCCVFFITDILWSWLFRLASGVWVSASFWFVQFLFVCLLYPLFVWITGHLFPQNKGDL